MTAVRVFTVDDQAVFRGIMRDVVEATPGFELAGEAASAEEALAALETVDPQLVLVDVRMPGMDGIELAALIAPTHPEMKIVLISIEDAEDLPSAARLGDRVPLVRKQEFGPRMLRRLWAR